MRLGHEWCGTVSAVGDGVDPSWVGRRVTGDTMLGCGRCRRCRNGLQHVCEDRYEVGIRGGFPGALAEQMAVPVTALHPLPDAVDAWRAHSSSRAGTPCGRSGPRHLRPGTGLLVLGPGTIGLLVAQFALAQGAEVHVMGRSERSLEFARTLGVQGAWTSGDLPAAALRRRHRRVQLARRCRLWRWSWSSQESEWCTWVWRARRASSTPARWC